MSKHPRSPLQISNVKPSKSIGTIFAGSVAISAMGILYSYIPDFTHPTQIGVWFSVVASFLIFVFNLLNREHQNWWAELMIVFWMDAFFLAGAIHGLGYVFPGWLWLIPVVAAYIFAWMLPFINHRLAKYLFTEQFTPKTRLGKGCMFIGLAVIAIGAPISIMVTRLTGEKSIMLITGIIFLIGSISFAQASAYQIVEKWWNKNRPSL